MTAPDERAAAREQVAYQVKCAAYNQPLMGVDWTRPENQRWLDVADHIIESALATHARRLEEARAALKNLIAELSSYQIAAVREGCGVTNAAVLNRRVIEARETLARLAPPPPRKEA